MGAGIDLEAAAAEPYHAMKATTGGGRRPGCCSVACSASLDNPGCFSLIFTAVMTTVTLLTAVALTAIVDLTYDGPSCSVHLTGYDSIDPSRAAQLVSPSFNITLRMNHTCVDRADLAVMYSGVALGWASVEPRDCVEGCWAKDIEIVARGHRVGLSQRLRDRMASDWRSGTVELHVDVKMYVEHKGCHSDTNIPQKMILNKVRIMQENSNS